MNLTFNLHLLYIRESVQRLFFVAQLTKPFIYNFKKTGSLHTTGLFCGGGWVLGVVANSIITLCSIALIQNKLKSFDNYFFFKILLQKKGSLLRHLFLCLYKT